MHAIIIIFFNVFFKLALLSACYIFTSLTILHFLLSIKYCTVNTATVHPVTWFKVKFPDGAIIGFRPSALKALNDKELSKERSKENNKDSSSNKSSKPEKDAKTKPTSGTASAASSPPQAAAKRSSREISSSSSSSSRKNGKVHNVNVKVNCCWG